MAQTTINPEEFPSLWVYLSEIPSNLQLENGWLRHRSIGRFNFSVVDVDIMLGSYQKQFIAAIANGFREI